MASSAGIAVFAKAPIEGFAKTRLIPLLGAKGAAALQGELIQQTIEVALRSNLGPVSAWCTPDCEHEAFASLAATYSVQLHIQSGPDLGARMLNAFETLTVQHPLLIIGTDCLVLTPPHLSECALALRNGANAVFLPTEDGGYALVGSDKPIPSLFCDMPWSTNQVMAETR
jgi:rSAM/selenodomain-associated transferase 1